MNNIHIGNLDQFLGRPKVVLATQGLDERKRVACRKCGTEMITGSRGGQSFSRGEYDDDIEEFLVCPVCGYEEEE